MDWEPIAFSATLCGAMGYVFKLLIASYENRIKFLEGEATEWRRRFEELRSKVDALYLLRGAQETAPDASSSEGDIPA